MSFALAYDLTVGPVLALSTAAVWPPRPWQIALVLAGPLITLAAALAVWPFSYLGWLAAFEVPCAVLLIAPVLPWPRRWAQLAIPATVRAICGGYVIAARWEVSIVFYFSFPALLAFAAVATTGLTWRGRP